MADIKAALDGGDESLSEASVREIVSQELLRKKVAARIDAATRADDRRSWWATREFWGSALGIWILSSVLLSGLTGGIAYVQNRFKEAAQRREAAYAEKLRTDQAQYVRQAKNLEATSRLNMEISYRMGAALERLSDLDSAWRDQRRVDAEGRLTGGLTAIDAEVLKRALAPLTRQPDTDFLALDAEYQARTGVSLMAEELRISERPVTWDEPVKTFARLSPGLRYQGHVADSPHQLATVMLSSIKPEWRVFPFTDCEPGNPFCR